MRLEPKPKVRGIKIDLEGGFYGPRLITYFKDINQKNINENNPFHLIYDNCFLCSPYSHVYSNKNMDIHGYYYVELDEIGEEEHSIISANGGIIPDELLENINRVSIYDLIVDYVIDNLYKNQNEVDKILDIIPELKLELI